MLGEFNLLSGDQPRNHCVRIVNFALYNDTIFAITKGEDYFSEL